MSKSPPRSDSLFLCTALPAQVCVHIHELCRGSDRTCWIPILGKEGFLRHCRPSPVRLSTPEQNASPLILQIQVCPPIYAWLLFLKFVLKQAAASFGFYLIKLSPISSIWNTMLIFIHSSNASYLCREDEAMCWVYEASAERYWCIIGRKQTFPTSKSDGQNQTLHHLSINTDMRLRITVTLG